VEIDISGPAGNAFVLIGQAKVLANQLELDWDPIHKDMQSSNYDHLLDVFEKHFGDYCQLVGRK
jgi:hypothetical protein